MVDRSRITYGRSLVAALVLALALMLLYAAAAPAPSSAAEEGTALPDSVAKPIARTKTALANLALRINAHQFVLAAKSADNVRLYLGRADVAATNLIGAPPVDPESDDLPGPPAVLAVLAVEHRVVNRGTPLFDGLQARIGLKAMLDAAMNRRDVMLDTVIALDPEGDGADYADGMADSVLIYDAEVETVRTVLNTAELDALQRDSVADVLAKARATQAKVQAAFGGGE
jgi:hypothetical protein